MTVASALTILILLPATAALMVGMERLAARAAHGSKVRSGQQLGSLVHRASFAERFRHHLLRILVIAAPVVLTVAWLRSEAS